MPSEDVLKWLIPFATGIGGIFVGGWLTSRRDVVSRKHAFITKQLQDFYSPLLGIRMEIRTRSELRERLSEAADAEWQQLVAEARASGGVEAVQRLQEEQFPTFKRMIDWDNKKLFEELLPAYRSMIHVFREHLWLAEPDTLEFLSGLVEFVEVWERVRDDSVPMGVVTRIGHGEEKLKPFYDHLESRVKELRGKLKDGRV